MRRVAFIGESPNIYAFLEKTFPSSNWGKSILLLGHLYDDQSLLPQKCLIKAVQIRILELLCLNSSGDIF